MSKTFFLEHVSCDLCHSDRYIERYRKPDNWLYLNQYQYPVVECLECGLVYVNPRPTVKDIGQFYPTGYHESRDDETHQARYAKQYKFIETYNFNTVLDIGCARGDWLNYIKQRKSDAELHGVDAFSDSVDFEAIEFQNKFLFEANLDSNYFDLITAWAVLEHVHTPAAYFESVARVLKKKGKFVFLVTNSESLYGKCAYAEDVPRHLYHFNRKSLIRFAEKYELALKEIIYTDQFWDGRGHGTFRYAIGKILGANWNRISLNKLNRIQKIGLRIGYTIDRLVFYFHWEAKFKASGNMLVVMEKL